MLKEDATTVQIRVRFEQSNRTSDLVAEVNEATAVLNEPVGDRKILDESGDPIPLKNVSDYPRVSTS